MNEVKEYIKIKRKKKVRKKIFMISTVVLIILIVFFTKSPLFNLKTITVEGTSNISAESVLETVNNRIGKNIFILNRNKMIKDILSEPYFLSAKIRMSGINSLNIIVTEESPVFYTKYDSNYYIFNDKGVLIEIANNIEGRNLVEITGVATEELQLGNKIINNEHIIETLEIIYPYIAENKESIKFDRFDLSKLYDIKGYMGDIEVFFGEITDFHAKINDVYNIILNGNVGITNGYIDVSIKNMPVIKKNEE